MQNNITTLVNGSFDGAVSVLDRGLAYGDGVFRTVKLLGGLPEHWPLHYQTLVKDCSAIGIVCPSAEVFISDFEQLATVDDVKSVAKIIVTRGEGERGYKPPAITNPMRIMIKSPFPVYPDRYVNDGVDLHLCETRISHQPKLAGVKHLNRLENVLARMEWHDPDIAEGLMLDIAGNVIECTAANVFARYEGTLFTPQLNLCGVDGITRQQVLSHAKSLKLKTMIEPMNLEQLLAADEMLICNSLIGVLQVRTLGNKQWSKQTLADKLSKAISQ